MPASSPLALPPGLSREFLLHHRVCPETRDSVGALTVAVAPSAAPAALEDIAIHYDCPVHAHDVDESEVDRLIERLTSGANREVLLERLVEDDGAADVRDLVHEAPVVRFVNLLVRDAVQAGASDIHLESTRDALWARFRVDGVLVAAPQPPRHLQHAILSRIKLLADLDIAERRRPQDGRIRVRLDEGEMDLRVATIPTMHGECVVLRLLDRAHGPTSVTTLGMPADIQERYLRWMGRPQGMIIVTGPTGSGKTSTLYAGLRQRTTLAEKVVTVEDPVEYELPGVTQVPVQAEHGVGFATALRAILRQDPDVVMVGEMRDAETAAIAVQAAMTGHLVVTTLHTNDAVSASVRMRDLGVAPYLIAATVEGVLAQRLLRRVCADCRGHGCGACRASGYRGRVGVFEALQMSDALRVAIAGHAPLEELRRYAADAGYVTLRQDGLRKVREGITTHDELARVLAD